MFCFVDNTSVNDVCVCVCVCGEKRWRVRRMRVHIEMDDTQQAMIGATMTNDILNTQMLESPAQGTS